MSKIFKKGFTLIEMLIYVAILAILMLVVVKTMYNMTQIYRTLAVSKNLNHAALVTMERITRDIKAGTSITTASSLLDTSPGVLAILSGTTTTTFYVENGVVSVRKDGVYEGPLTRSDVRTTALMFNLSTASTSQAVKITLTLESGTSTKYQTETFYGTAVLRSSY